MVLARGRMRDTQLTRGEDMRAGDGGIVALALLSLFASTEQPAGPVEVRFAVDSPLEGAVSSEPVSEAKFPASWENAGNFIDSELDGASTRAKKIIKSVPYGPIPYASEQGIFCGLAGN